MSLPAGADAAATQKRGRRIAMSGDEVDAFLGVQRTCRVATTSHDGPHLTPLWFVWHNQAIWLYSLDRSQRWADIVRSPRIAVLVDAGVEYATLHGVEIRGEAAVVGEVPRTGAQLAAEEQELLVVEGIFARKYFDIAELWHDGRHAWLRVVPDALRSWDFRKI
ncbi:Pyridoxamine 5'-phosphate oxidase [Frankineae bacterium MT45]|nr:Pyridoxamine 5'-phosphate oxidase [Frankineae bacterium MT45]